MKKRTPFLVLIVFFIATVNHVESHKHSDNPLLLLVSFDGFRHDYMTMYDLPPSHWTIATGLFDESHGVVNNDMYDPQLNKTFTIANKKDQSLEWFGQNKLAEPIWIANQKGGNGRKSAAEWPGSAVNFSDQPFIQVDYNSTFPFTDYIDTFIKLFTAEHQPINFGALYFNEPGMQKVIERVLLF